MIPTYENGYAIVEIEGQFHCMKNEQPLLKFSKEPAVFSSQGKAEDFLACQRDAKRVLMPVVEDDDDLFGSFESEVDIRRQGGKSEYLDSLDADREAREREHAKPVATFILEEQYRVGEIVWSGILQYRVTEKPNYVSPAEADSLEDLQPGINSGWYTKVELVRE